MNREGEDRGVKAPRIGAEAAGVGHVAVSIETSDRLEGG